MKEDQINHSHLITSWLEKECERLQDQIKKTTKVLDEMPCARQELFSDGTPTVQLIWFYWKH